jgi:phytoene synthase
MDASYRHCEALVRAADKDRFLATLFAPGRKRGPLFALYAFNIEIAGVRDRVREPMAGEIRLQWWRDVLDGERGGEAAANPVAAALTRHDRAFSLPKRRCSISSRRTRSTSTTTRCRPSSAGGLLRQTRRRC